MEKQVLTTHSRRQGWRRKEASFLYPHQIHQYLRKWYMTFIILLNSCSLPLKAGIIHPLCHVKMSSRSKVPAQGHADGGSGVQTHRPLMAPRCCHQQESPKSLNLQRRLILAALCSSSRKPDKARAAVSENISASRFEDLGVL